MMMVMIDDDDSGGGHGYGNDDDHNDHDDGDDDGYDYDYRHDYVHFDLLSPHTICNLPHDKLDKYLDEKLKEMKATGEKLKVFH